MHFTLYHEPNVRVGTVNVHNTLDSKWTTKVERMSSCSIFKRMTVENLTPLPSLNLGGLGIWSYGKNGTKSESIKKITNEQLKTCIEGECGELITIYSLKGPFF
jgi:hypothetical protein